MDPYKGFVARVVQIDYTSAKFLRIETKPLVVCVI